MLLSDARVANYLKENFVLCWNSIRPAPKVTIDFGNGRTLERTIKGNTTFHLCLADGRVVDSLPGVYQPQAFLKELRESAELLELTETEILNRHRTHSLALGGRMEEALSKAIIEAPLVKALEPIENPTRSGEIVDVSAQPLTLKEVENDHLSGPGPLAERALEADSLSSLTVLRPEVHRWFGRLRSLPTPEQARGPIYKDILKVDIDDPYLGLKFDDLPGT